MPKTFETFRKHKLAGDEKYKLWKLDFQRQNDLLQHPEKLCQERHWQYFFNPENRDGWKKGDAFSSRLEYNVSNWEKMRAEILSAAKMYPATFKNETLYGCKYEQLVILQGLKNKPANVLVGWIIHPDGTAHMIIAHMEEVK